jgi:hypothetical protein
MLTAIENAIDTLKRIREDVPALIEEIIDENKERIADMNRANLDEGRRADGSSLPDYSPVSVSKFGKRPGPMTLEKTGAFKKRIVVKAHRTFAEIIGLDSKTGMLQARHGIDITGVSDDDLEVIKWEIVLPGLQEKIIDRYLK